MNIRRLLLDVDKAMQRPSIIEIAEAISASAGVQACNITVSDIDVETVGMNVTVEGENINYDALVSAIEHVGAVVHSIDEIVIGERVIERVQRAR